MINDHPGKKSSLTHVETFPNLDNNLERDREENLEKNLELVFLPKI